MKRFDLALLVACFLAAVPALAQSVSTNIPIGGYTPFVGLGLTDEYKGENHADNFFTADVSLFPVGNWLGIGEPHFEWALYDTGASVSLITVEAAAAFDLAGHGFDGTEILPIGGATGQLNAIVTDPLGVFVTGLGNRTASANGLELNTSSMVGLTSMSIAEAPPEWTLPNVVGLPVASQFTTFIRADEPLIFRQDGQTVRTPQLDLLPLGSGSQGITRRAPLTLKNSAGFLTPPLYIFNILNILEEEPLTENPSAPTVVGQADAGLFLTVDITNDGNTQDEQLFLFDTGASVSAVSQVMAAQLGFDPVLDEPDFEVQVEGSGGTIESVPGFYAEELTVATVGGGFTLHNVPLVVLDITDPSNIGNVLPGLIGTNLFSDRNVVIDPVPSAGGGGVGPSLYISDPVTLDRQWMATEPVASWHDPESWGQSEGPGVLWAANVQNRSPFSQQQAHVTSDSQIHRLLLSGSEDGNEMLLFVFESATLAVFGGVTVERHGHVVMRGGTLDAQFVDLRDGAVLRGAGTVRAEFDNREGIVAPGTVHEAGELVIEGTFANRGSSNVAIDLGGRNPVEEHDVLTIDGDAFLGGTLDVAITNFGAGIFRPQVGDEFEIITTTGEGRIFGMFDELFLPTFFVWDVEYFTDSVRLEVVESLEVPGDYNGNGLVEQVDLDLVLANWGFDGIELHPRSGWVSNPPTGSIDQEELDRVLANWGLGRGTTLFSASGVPEPATISLLLCVVAAGMARRFLRSGR